MRPSADHRLPLSRRGVGRPAGSLAVGVFFIGSFGAAEREHGFGARPPDQPIPIFETAFNDLNHRLPNAKKVVSRVDLVNPDKQSFCGIFR
jgi:hypothetical protein